MEDWEKMVQESDEFQDFVPVDRLYKPTEKLNGHLFNYDIDFNKFIQDMKYILEKSKERNEQKRGR
jgi:hypothetical protein